MKRLTFIAGGILFPKAHGKPELTPEEIRQIYKGNPWVEMFGRSEPVFRSAKRWPAIDKLVAKINRQS